MNVSSLPLAPSSGWFLIIAAVLAFSPPLHAAEEHPEVPSHVTKVSVFPRGAEVTREASINLEPGSQSIVITGFPRRMRSDSLRVRIAGGGVRLDDVRTSVRTEPLVTDQIRDLEDRLKEALANLDLLRDREVLLNEERDFLAHIRSAVSRKEGTSIDLDAALDSMGLWSDRLKGNIGAQRELAIEKASAEDVHKTIAQELSQARRQGSREARIVLLQLNSDSAQEISVELRYHTNDASWRTDYRLHVDSAARSAQLELYALVSQQSDEDWANAQLELTTRAPSEDADFPILTPIVLREYQSREQSGRGRTTDPLPDFVVESPTAGYRRATAVTAHRLEAMPVDRLTTTAFLAPHRVDIEAGADRARVFLAEWDLEGTWKHKILPQAREAAFLTLELPSPSAVPLPEGEMAVHTDGAFLGRSRFPVTLPGDDLELSVGPDEGLRVEWKLLERVRETAGVMQRRTRYRYSYTLDIHNSRSHEANIEVQNRIPVSSDERIAVRLLTQPARATEPDEEGFLTWTRTFAPGTRESYKLEYTVEFPRDLLVVPLE